MGLRPGDKAKKKTTAKKTTAKSASKPDERKSTRKPTGKKQTAKKTTRKKTTARSVKPPTQEQLPETPMATDEELPQGIAEPTPPDDTEEESDAFMNAAEKLDDSPDDEAEVESQPKEQRHLTKQDQPTPKEEVVAKLGGVALTRVGEEVDWVKMLVYADPGAGKTYLAGTAALVEAMSPVLYIDIEGGVKTLRAFPKEARDRIYRVRVRDEIDPKSGKIKRTAWEKLQDVYDDVRKGKLPVKTIVFDNATESHALAMSLALSFATEKAEAKGRDKDPEVPEQADWGRAGIMIRKMFRAFRDLDCHVIFTAHEVEKKDERSGKTTIGPSLPGKLAKEIPGYVDEVFYLYVKARVDPKSKQLQVTRKILCQPNGKHMAKDRSDRMPIALEDPTMEKIAALAISDGKESD